MIIQVPEPIVEIHQLTISYDNLPVLWNIDCSFSAGQIIGIIGPNGAGKSTLVKAILGLIKPNSGYVKIFNNNIENVRKRIAYVPQKETIDLSFPASVLDVVKMGLFPHKGLFNKIKNHDLDKVYNALNMVNLTEFKDRRILNLSGGQLQRMFIARALVQEPDIFFLDEPFTGIDMVSEEAIIKILKNLILKQKTIFIIHHDLQSVLNYFDWLVMLNTHLVASGPTEKIFNPSLLKSTYGGKLSILNKLANILKDKQFPIRE